MDFLYPILFWVLAAFIGVSAVAMVVTQNIVRAATWLLFTLAGTAGIFFLLGADFVGATQLLVYVGGTLVLVVFGVMLTAQGPFINLKIAAGEWAIAAFVGIGFFSVLAFTYLSVTWEFQAEHPPIFATPAAEIVAAGGTPVADTGDKPNHRSLAASIVLGEALLGFEKTAPEQPITGVHDVLFTVPDATAPPEALRDLFKRKARTQMSYLLPFEIVSVHLLVVLIGAAYLARSKRRRGGA